MYYTGVIRVRTTIGGDMFEYSYEKNAFGLSLPNDPLKHAVPHRFEDYKIRDIDRGPVSIRVTPTI